MSFTNTEFLQPQKSKTLHASHVELAKGTVAHNQSHAAETLVIVLEGAWRFRLPGRVVTLKKDELLRIPARELYSAEALADTTALKIATEIPREPQHPARPEDPDQYLWGV